MKVMWEAREVIRVKSNTQLLEIVKSRSEVEKCYCRGCSGLAGGRCSGDAWRRRSCLGLPIFPSFPFSPIIHLFYPHINIPTPLCINLHAYFTFCTSIFSQSIRSIDPPHQSDRPTDCESISAKGTRLTQLIRHHE